MKFVLATFNRDKVREMRNRLRRYRIELIAYGEMQGVSSPVETGATLLENARLKAKAALESTGLPAIADDTGLEIDALSGRPGVRSARYAGPGASDRRNVEVVLEQLSKVPRGARSARFRTVMVACFPDQPEIVVEGVLEGAITDSPRGQGGFGYDPIFEVAGDGRTLAELSLEEKIRISHRTRALDALMREIGLG